MSSEILDELKALSVKLDVIRNEISELHKKVSNRLSTGDDHVASSNNSPVDQSSCHSNGDVMSTHTPASNSNESKSASVSNIEVPGDRLETEKSKPDGSKARKNKLCTKVPTTARGNHHNKERTASYSQRSFKECREECLRKALQQNIVSLVDNLPYSENDIIDMLIENECLTETECSDLRNNTSRKDRVRNLIRIIKGRTFKVIKTFVECVQKLHPEVAASIWLVYEKQTKDKKNYHRQCTFCVLKRSTDIKFIADHIWSIGAISDDLYYEIVDGRTEQEILWAKFAEECNTGNVRQTVLRKISEALTNKVQYHDLVLKLSKLTDFRCACVTANVMPSETFESGSTRVPEIKVCDSEENSTVSPRSTPTSFHSHLDEFEIESDDDTFLHNRHENYLLSAWTHENDKQLYTSYFGIRKCSVYAQNVELVDFRKSRSSSFGKKAGLGSSLQEYAKRRASMFM